MHIDRLSLLQTAGQDHTLCLELLEIFARTFAQDVQALNTALQADDTTNARHTLHRIKGSIQILGIQSVATQIDEIAQQFNGSIDATLALALKQLFESFKQINEEAISILESGAL